MQDNVKRRRRRHLRWNKQSKFASWKCIYCVMDSNGGQPGNPETARARAAHQRESNTSVLVLLEMEDFAELQCCGSRLLPLWKKIIATLIWVKQQMWWIFYLKKKWRQKERSDPSAAHWVFRCAATASFCCLRQPAMCHNWHFYSRTQHSHKLSASAFNQTFGPSTRVHHLSDPICLLPLITRALQVAAQRYQMCSWKKPSLPVSATYLIRCGYNHTAAALWYKKVQII